MNYWSGSTHQILLLLTFSSCALVLARNNGYTRHSSISLSGRKYRVPSRTNVASRSSSQSQYSNGYLNPAAWTRDGITSRGSQSHSSTRGSRGSHHVRLSSQRSRLHPSRRRGPRSNKPNIVVIMTDDQDVLLGSLKYMPKVRRLLINQGVYFNNSFVSTPMCCPSRSSFLTGMYVHNHNVYTNNMNCSSLSWRNKYEYRAFPTYINESYTTGYFGKYLNDYDGSHIPAGWKRWVGLIRNSRFYNYTVVNEKGVKTNHYDNYYKDYLTDLVANDSVSFLHESRRRYPNKPLMMMLSLPAPHGPEDAAPQYQHMFDNNTDHRTPAWNYAPNEDKQWLLQHTYPMMPQYKMFTDLLQRRRLQTLQSVDDLVEKVVDELSLLGELDNTYIIYTSDHGYHLGQYGLIKGKAMPFDFDVRVPLIVRGPGIKPGSVISNIVNNIDMAPSIVDIAGQRVPDHMDGQSILRVLKAARDPRNVDRRGFVTLKRPWKDTVLLERGKLSEKIMRQRMRTEELNYYATGTKQGRYFFGSERRRKLYLECANGENKLPCKPQQKWYCVEDNGRLRKHKCRHRLTVQPSANRLQRDEAPATFPCPCRNKSRNVNRLGRRERRKQRRAMKQAKKLHKARRKRSTAELVDMPVGTAGVQRVPFKMFEPRLDVRCRILMNDTVQCDQDVYYKPLELEHHRETIDDMIKEYRKALEDLKDIRRHLWNQRPYQDEQITKTAKSERENDCSCDENGNIIEIGSGKRKNRKKILRKARRKKRNMDCKNANMNCFTHDNNHWKTPPYWHYGPFCFCSNANNNTYWCLRTVNQTHDFLYCEFITLFMSYYDMKTDPHQLHNIVTDINYGVLQQLHDELNRFKHCKGAQECQVIGRQQNQLETNGKDWEGLSHLRKQSRSRKKYHDDYRQSYYEPENKYTDGWTPRDLEDSPDYE